MIDGFECHLTAELAGENRILLDLPLSFLFNLADSLEFMRIFSHQFRNQLTVRCALFLTCLLLKAQLSTIGAEQEGGFTPLFNGRDFSGWKVPEGDNGHWKIL